MKLSIVVCFYNRIDKLSELLSDLSCQNYSSHDWELVLVDNGSFAIDSKYLYNILGSSLKHRIFLEKKQGLSFARNTGFHNSIGEWVMFLDDDVRVENNFVKDFLKKIESLNDIDIITPRIKTEIRLSWPSWLKERISSGIGQYDLGEEEQIIGADNKLPIGACLCFRRRLYDISGPFESNLGRMGKKLLGGEESLFLKKCYQANSKGLYYPKIEVVHDFVSQKMSKKYWLNQAYYGGVSSIRMILHQNTFYKTVSLLQLLGISVIKAVYWYSQIYSFESVYKGMAHTGRARECMRLILKR